MPQAVIAAQSRSVLGDIIGYSKALDEIGLRWARQVGLLIAKRLA